jgi:hypothetical protein
MVSGILEGVGVSAYLGMSDPALAPFIYSLFIIIEY